MSAIFFSSIIILLASCRKSPPKTLPQEDKQAELTMNALENKEKNKTSCDSEEELYKKLEEELKKKELPKSLTTNEPGCSVK